MNRPSNKPADKDPRRTSARRTAITVVLIVAAIYVGFMILVWSRHH